PRRRPGGLGAVGSWVNASSSRPRFSGCVSPRRLPPPGLGALPYSERQPSSAVNPRKPSGYPTVTRGRPRTPVLRGAGPQVRPRFRRSRGSLPLAAERNDDALPLLLHVLLDLVAVEQLVQGGHRLVLGVLAADHQAVAVRVVLGGLPGQGVGLGRQVRLDGVVAVDRRGVQVLQRPRQLRRLGR